jgi:gluconolactonase
VDRIRIEGDGSPGRIETVAEFPRTVPDGVAFDVDGSLYVSMYRPDVIYRRTPDGQIDILAEDFEGTLMAAPTNIAFCGRNRDVLLSTNLGRWHITRYEVGVAGHPLNYPDIG